MNEPLGLLGQFLNLRISRELPEQLQEFLLILDADVLVASMVVTLSLRICQISTWGSYSRLMGVDEQGTLEALKKHRSGLIEPKAA